MEAPTDLETARQLDMLWRRVCEGITKASEGITKADGILEQAREVRAEVQTGISRSETVQSEIAQLVQQNRLQVEQVQQLSATVEQLHNDVVSAKEKIGSQDLETLQQELQDARIKLGEAIARFQEAEERLYRFETELQERSTALERLTSQVEEAGTTASRAKQQADEKTVKVLQVQSEVEKLAQSVISIVNELGGREGLESLQREFQEWREVLSQIQSYEQRLHSGIEAASHTVQELLRAQGATQETAYRVEQRSLEVSNLAQQVRSDREAIQSVRLEVESLLTTDTNQIDALETLVHEQLEIERLNKQLLESQAELGQRLQIQAQSQQRLRNWLLGVTFAVALALALAIPLAR